MYSIYNIELINNKLIEHSNLEPHHSLKDLSKNNVYYVNIGIQIVDINIVFPRLISNIQYGAFALCESLTNVFFTIDIHQ